MIELSQLTLLVMTEVIIGLAILSGVLVYFAVSRKGRIRRAAHHLAERVQGDKPARSERLRTLLSEHYGLEGSELEQMLHTIVQAEMQMFQNLINGYLKDDQVHLQQIDVDEENLVLAYQGLKPSQIKSATGASGDEGSEDEVRRLQEENQRLSDELRVTMDTMGRMLNEYSSMFAGGVDKPLTRSAGEPPEAVSGEASEPDVTPEQVGEEEIEVEIPELEAQDSVDEPVTEYPDTLLDNEAGSDSALEEDVSEIIDEVMEMADDIAGHGEETREAEGPAADVGESLLDELEQVEIELPESLSSTPAGESSQTGSEDEPEAGSLEEEWARLLEEDAASKDKSDQK